MALAPAKIDLGKLAAEWLAEGPKYPSKSAFLQHILNHLEGGGTLEAHDVVLYGFGRIGRLCARELIRQAGKGQQLRLRAVVLRKIDDASLKNRAALLANDSVHGEFGGTIEVDCTEQCILVNGQRIQFIAASDPAAIDYTAYGIDNVLAIDNTGVFRDREALSLHLQSKGAAKVLLTAPGEGVPNIVYGINQGKVALDSEDVYSAASCTTKAISPVLKVVEDAFGLNGYIETVHAYSNDQNLLDNMHKKHRRGRSAAVNMVITETGAGNAVTKVIPGLAGKLTANAVRVPTPNGSLAILHLSLKREVTREEVLAAMKKPRFRGPRQPDPLFDEQGAREQRHRGQPVLLGVRQPGDHRVGGRPARGLVCLVRQRVWVHEAGHSAGQTRGEGAAQPVLLTPSPSCKKAPRGTPFLHHRSAGRRFLSFLTPWRTT